MELIPTLHEIMDYSLQDRIPHYASRWSWNHGMKFHIHISSGRSLDNMVLMSTLYLPWVYPHDSLMFLSYHTHPILISAAYLSGHTYLLHLQDGISLTIYSNLHPSTVTGHDFDTLPYFSCIFEISLLILTHSYWPLLTKAASSHPW